jgi:hypothetical protein
MQKQTGIQTQESVVGVTEIPPSVTPEVSVPPRNETETPDRKNTTWLSLGLVVATGVVRLLTRIPNFTPVGALGLFGGGRLKAWQAYSLPLLVMLATDILKVFPLSWRGLSAVNWLTPWVYASFLIYVLLGRWLCRNRSFLWIGLASLLGSVQFFLITNFGFWVTNQEKFFPYTLQGLLACYIGALPFFGLTLAGDLVYSGVLFGGYALAAPRAYAPKARLAS